MISKAENARSPIHFLQCWRQMPFHQGDRGWRDKDMPSNITLARENKFSSSCNKSTVPKSKTVNLESGLTYNGPSENLTSSKFALSPLCFLLGGILDPLLPSSTYEQSALELFITNVAVKYIVELICIQHHDSHWPSPYVQQDPVNDHLAKLMIIDQPVILIW